MKKSIAIVAFVLAAGVFGWWIKDGMGMATQTQVQVCKEVEDDFGEKEKVCKWVDQFKLGLLDGALPAGGGLIGVGVLMLFLSMREPNVVKVEVVNVVKTESTNDP